MRLNEYHILCTVNESPCLLRVLASSGKDALSAASKTGTNLIILFATRSKQAA